MGIISNPEISLSSKDSNNVSMEYNSSSDSDSDHHDDKENMMIIKKQDEANSHSDSDSNSDAGSEFPALKIKLPSLKIKNGGIEEEEEDGYKTPTSAEHKIPVVFVCPPAPRAPKSKPMKRKLPSPDCRRSMIFEFSGDIEGIFPRPADLGGIVKKVKHT